METSKFMLLLFQICFEMHEVKKVKFYIVYVLNSGMFV